MRIVFLPSLLAPVAEGACFGGAEMAALALAEGLARRGHEVSLIGLPGSGGAGVEPWIVPRGTLIFRPGDEPDAGAPGGDPFPAIFDALERRDFDVLHLHLLDPEALVRADRLARSRRVRVIATLHLAALFPATVSTVRALLDRGTEVVFTAPSRFAAASWGPSVRAVQNGVEVAAIPFSAEPPPDRRLVWAGRRSREKGLAEAAAIAQLAGAPLSIAGAEAPEGSVAVSGEGIEDLGVLPRSAVPSRLYARALATLVTSSIPESFSLVAAESLASGTPVIAFEGGAIREVIEDGVTGLVVPQKDEGAAAEAARAIAAGAIDRRRCRAAAEARLDHRRTIDCFESLYASRYEVPR